MTSRVKKHTLGHNDSPQTTEHRQSKRAKSDNTEQPNKTQSTALPKVDMSGDNYWDLSKSRRVTVSNFRGKAMVNIREYYEKDGHELPGKKGISLPIEQYARLVTVLPDIELAIKAHGESVPRPSYDNEIVQSSANDEAIGEVNAPASSESPRKNIEATSDEESGEE
ncbi:transcriptional coactivator p15/PC4 family protein [Aspergillus aculeatinus CBS 121060]|uniref:RNA polymerase II transcriptional coactivator n=1 Tax=Aspergillus aculeatinus CBS 121060 TaxID=1448322 RepID=A0ACD1HJ28_9EURO|nr:putative RNA polymerase II transcriptional coactivator [Aspergillus aculeatinus CBS 121060]RAH73595.1 putative RNA polymerase II transcriptional coactivator [Aspergillus aculeatinus CBS 121060]